MRRPPEVLARAPSRSLLHLNGEDTTLVTSPRAFTHDKARTVGRGRVSIREAWATPTRPSRELARFGTTVPTSGASADTRLESLVLDVGGASGIERGIAG
jgi:hypothetical protein